ncbi:MAG TPA: class I SAM-dependent methyltransferase [Christensenellaceae bacterium]|jgi:ubiquinone/menaquinone biosynthesis C-methylase UbiE|nr:class I SAM-dependent methyltransferase [Christensenellaceae bacterium]
MKNEAVFWDRVAVVYDVFVNVINAKTHKTLCKEIEPLFSPTDTVLECACGTGMLTRVIAPKCREIIATDFSKNMVEKTQAKCKSHKNIRFMVEDIINLSFDDASFDKVIAANVLHLLDDPYQALKELDRVCKPGGKIIIPTYINQKSDNKENKFVKAVGKIGAFFKETFSFSTYRQFIIDAGYKCAHYIEVDGFIPCLVVVIDK